MLLKLSDEIWVDKASFDPSDAFFGVTQFVTQFTHVSKHPEAKCRKQKKYV